MGIASHQRLPKHYQNLQLLVSTAIMKLFVALLPALLSLGSATTLTERRNSELQQRASCSDPQQYYCRYGFCCGYAESCDVGGCNGGSSGAARCSRQGQICGSRSGYKCCDGLTCKGAGPDSDGLCAGPDGSTEYQDDESGYGDGGIY